MEEVREPIHNLELTEYIADFIEMSDDIQLCISAAYTRYQVAKAKDPNIPTLAKLIRETLENNFELVTADCTEMLRDTDRYTRPDIEADVMLSNFDEVDWEEVACQWGVIIHA